jgi:hypothetical protein
MLGRHEQFDERAAARVVGNVQSRADLLRTLAHAGAAEVAGVLLHAGHGIEADAIVTDRQGQSFRAVRQQQLHAVRLCVMDDIPQRFFRDAPYFLGGAIAQCARHPFRRHLQFQ